MAIKKVFQPEVPVFDGNVCLGRGRKSKKGTYAGKDDLLDEMDKMGVEKALVHHPDTQGDITKGNQRLLRRLESLKRLIPQFTVNPVHDLLSETRELVIQAGVKSIRLYPKTHKYPLLQWILDSWIDWVREEGLSLWIPIEEVKIRDLYPIGQSFPDVPIVLSDVHYTHYTTAMLLMDKLPNTYMDLSRFDVGDGVRRFVNQFGAGRFLYGSSYPDLAMGPYLYYLHQSVLDEEQLRKICFGNLRSLIGKKVN